MPKEDEDLERYKKAILSMDDKGPEKSREISEQQNKRSQEHKEEPSEAPSEQGRKIQDDRSERANGLSRSDKRFANAESGSTEEKKPEEKKERATEKKPGEQKPLSEQIPLETLPPENRTSLRVKGVVSEGAARGKDLIERYEPRLKHLVGYSPYPGTLNIKLEKKIHMEDIEERRIQHVLFDGKLWIDARLARAKLFFKNFIEECWVIREETGIHEENTVEIINKDNLKEKLGLKTGDQVEIEVSMRTKKSFYEKFKQSLRKFLPKSRRIMKA